MSLCKDTEHACMRLVVASLYACIMVWHHGSHGIKVILAKRQKSSCRAGLFRAHIFPVAQQDSAEDRALFMQKCFVETRAAVSMLESPNGDGDKQYGCITSWAGVKNEATNLMLRCDTRVTCYFCNKAFFPICCI